MINFSKIYENKVGPLQEARVLNSGELYITEDGTRIRYLGEDDGSLSFEIQKASPLLDGYVLSGLSNDKGGLPLFWKLLNKSDEDSSTE